MKYSLEDLLELKSKIVYYDYPVTSGAILDIISSVESMVKSAEDASVEREDEEYKRGYDIGYEEGHRDGQIKLKEDFERFVGEKK